MATTKKKRPSSTRIELDDGPMLVRFPAPTRDALDQLLAASFPDENLRPTMSRFIAHLVGLGMEQWARTGPKNRRL